MGKLLMALMFLFLSPAMLFAQSAFDGTWRFDLQSGQFAGNPHTLILQKRMYRCDTCVPKFEIKADGQDHKVSGNPYFDTVSEINDHTIEQVSK
jgi:hypothetical protein